MIVLRPPYPVVDGHVLLPDHADPALFHVLPAAPSLALTADGTPELTLTQHLGGGAGAATVSGAILQLTTELATPDELLATLAARTGVDGARVQPVAFDTGTVELTVLGRTNAPPADGSAAPGGDFEVTFAAGGRPSLGNTNRAAFQLILDEPAAELIEACLDLPELPVLVTYAMSFTALRPSFTVDIHADWHKVYSSLQSKVGFNAWVAAADVDIAITDALETGGVDVETVVLGAGDGSAAAAARVRQQLLDWVLERLFQPMGPPPDKIAQAGQAIGDAVWSVARAILPGASYKLRQVEETQLRTLDIRARESVAEVREARPQGTLGALLRGLRLDADGDPSPAWPAIRERLVQRVELDGFPRLEVAVGVVDRFTSDGVRAVRVQLARRLADGTSADEAEFSFTRADQRHDYVVNLLGDLGWDAPYCYRVVVDFAPDSSLRPAGLGESAESPWRVRRVADLVVDPREAYAVTDVTVAAAPLFSYALFPAVTVELKAPGAAPARLVLEDGAGEQSWRYASSAAGPDRETVTPYEWRATYHRPIEAGGDVTTPWASTVEPWLSLPDPMPEKLVATFFVDLPWADVTTALLELEYVDEAHDVRYAEETIPLGPDTPVISRTYSIAAGGSRALRHRLTIKLAAGGLVEGSWRETTDDRVVVDRRFVDERLVLLRAVGGTLADAGLAALSVTLEARDPATGAVRATTTVPVPPGGESGFVARFSHLRGDPPIRTVFSQVTAVGTTGSVRRTPWAESGADLLVLDIRSQTVTG